jgi:hypothetical protein
VLSSFLEFVVCWPDTQILSGKVQELMLVLPELECMIFVYPNMQLFKWKKWLYLPFPLYLILPGSYHLLVRYSDACRRCSGTDIWNNRIGMYDFCISQYAIIQVEEMILSDISSISHSSWRLPLADKILRYLQEIYRNWRLSCANRIATYDFCIS